MSIERVILSVMPGERRLAIVENGRLAELVQVRADIESRIGEIRLGRVTKAVGGLDAAFVDVGLASPGFLALAEARPKGKAGGAISDFVREGDAVVVQILRDPIGDKGVKLTTRIDAETPVDTAGVRPPKLLRAPPDAVLARLLALPAEDLPPIAVDDGIAAVELTAALKPIRPDLAARVERAAGDIFVTEGIEDEIEAALSPRISLAGGGALTIEETEALVAIDVDSGDANAGGQTQTALAVNLRAAEEIARQARLRRLGGLMVVDFLPLGRRPHRDRLIARLREAFAGDTAGIEIAGFTRLGLVETIRRRQGPSLLETMTRPARGGIGREPHPVARAFAALRAVRREAKANPGRALTLRAHEAVLRALEGPAAAALGAVEAQLGRALGRQIDPALVPGDFSIVAGSGDNGYGDRR